MAKQGWYNKFTVIDNEGKDPDDSVYLVLRLNGKDRAARKAAQVYADEVKADNPQFAFDIETRLNEFGP